MSQEERDILIRLDQNVTNLIQTVKDHVDTDKASFKEQGGRIKVIERIMYMGLGMLTLIQFIFKFL